MSEHSSREKKLIRAPEDLVLKLNEVANRQGRTFYSYVTEIFEQAVRAYEMKHSLKEVLDEYELLQIHKEAGATLAPRDLLEYLIETVPAENSEELQRLWYNSGRWYGIYIKEKFDDAVDAFVRLLRDGRLDLNEATMNRTRDGIDLKCVSTDLSLERTMLLQKFIEGAMYSMGYESEKAESFRGIIRLRFSPLKVS